MKFGETLAVDTFEQGIGLFEQLEVPGASITKPLALVRKVVRYSFTLVPEAKVIKDLLSVTATANVVDAAVPDVVVVVVVVDVADHQKTTKNFLL